MARGKLKYRDVVGGGSKHSKKSSKKKVKPRKTYSLYSQDHKKSNKKRKFNKADEDDNDFEKRQRFEKETENQHAKQPSSSSESENEEPDHLQQLRATFSSKLKNQKSFAIDSSEDSSADDGSDDNEDKAEKSEEEDNAESDAKDEDIEDLNEEEEIETEASHPDDGDDNLNDPFVKHLFYELHENLLDSLTTVPVKVNNHVQNWSRLGRLIVQIPQYQEIEEKKEAQFSIAEEKKFAPAGTVPNKIDSKDLMKPESFFIKPQIINNLSKANIALKDDEVLFTPLQNELFSIINNYQDLYWCERNFDYSEEIRFIYCLHAVNHILKTRMKVVHHNVRLKGKNDVPEEFRDQGLVRPKILIIVPFKDAAYKIVQTIIKILLPEDKGHVMNKKRFTDEYTGNEIIMPKKNPKPEDYERTFAGNINDDFKIGLTVTKKSLKLYADFYSSDIIIASPLGLRTIIGAEGEAERNYDFLASIELLILDQTELFFMQNWDHLIHIFNHLHLQPKDSHGTDFSRVRTWSLNGWAKYYRQTLIFSSIVLPEINSIFNKKCSNYAGKIKISNPVDFGAIAQVVVQVPHVFHKFEAENAQQSIDARFDFFVNKILPQQRDSLMKQTLVYVSNYFDYVRLRNYFKREDLSFVQICEYSKDGKIARARDMFYHGDAHFLLYTERYHFFNRIRIKGIRHLVFYQPPNFPHFYYEMCNLMQETNMNKKIGNMSNMTVSVLYSKYDIHQVAAIVGTERVTKMIHSERNVHMMVTGAD